MLTELFSKIDELYEDMVATRRYLHQHPELSFKEEKTAAYIADTYEKLGIPYKKNVGGNGVVATLKGGKPGKKIALRADFDALPIQEENEVPYKSTVPNVMHACGHDGHTATLLGIAKAAKALQDELPGTLVFVHQHAEEYAPGGAKSIIETGILDDVDAVFGTHLWSNTPLGTIETADKEFMAGADRFEIEIIGKGGHGAQPHQTKDAVLIGSQVVTALQQIISRRLDPLHTAVITIGTFEAGAAFNVIADSAKLTGTVRTFDTAVQKQIKAEIENVLKGITTANGASYKYEYIEGYPPVINHPAQAQLVLDASKEVAEVREANKVLPTMTGEDFAYYLHNKPGAFFFTGAKKEDHYYPHHHPKFDFDERAMVIAAKTLLSTCMAYQ
ncbi:M20 family metallopeptidase [Terribacillus sp. 7520-G]|uniref:M20 metallopeptidase family protein n=1 Tax=Terribacillus TaxID=459532 RepID=UPI000BA5C399|nr:M20 family metallopeptidase [Terribacillus sp. 7520-G]PAD38188.1 peptidase M20 [Terribacillus sp. 7520-G]